METQIYASFFDLKLKRYKILCFNSAFHSDLSHSEIIMIIILSFKFVQGERALGVLVNDSNLRNFEFI